MALSTRDWFGFLAGIGWGLCLGYFFKSDNTAGLWLVILLGPPAILLISPGRPILSWQVPIVTAIVAGTFISAGPDETVAALFGEGSLAWLMCTLFSAPWVLIFHQRTRLAREEGRVAPGSPGAYLAVGVLVFLACSLLLLGFAVIVYPIWSSEFMRWASFLYGALMVTIGAGVSITSYQLGKMLGVAKQIRAILELVLVFVFIAGAIALIVLARSASHLSKLSNAPAIGLICCSLSILESLAALTWLKKAAKQEKEQSRDR